jgi:hypothetical protein
VVVVGAFFLAVLFVAGFEAVVLLGVSVAAVAGVLDMAVSAGGVVAAAVSAL